MGRPTDYYPEICDGFEDRFRDGQSILEVAVDIGVCRDTLYEWAKVHPAFSDALSRGRAVSQAWWEKQGRVNLFDHEEYDAESKISTKKRFNDRLWKENICKRFKGDWADRQLVELSGSVSAGVLKVPEKMTPEEWAAAAAAQQGAIMSSAGNE